MIIIVQATPLRDAELTHESFVAAARAIGGPEIECKRTENFSKFSAAFINSAAAAEFVAHMALWPSIYGCVETYDSAEMT